MRTKGEYNMKKIIFTALMLATFISFGGNASEALMRELPEPAKTGGKPLMEVISTRKTDRSYSSRSLDEQTLSDILYAAWGISHDGKRTIPTSQNKQALSVYAVMADGVWKYNANKNVLEMVADTDMRPLFETQEFVKGVPLILVYVGTDAKNSPMHAGSAYQNVGLYAASKGLHNVVRGYFDRVKVAKALGLSGDEQVIVSQVVGWPASDE